MKQIRWFFLIGCLLFMLGCDLFKDNPDEPPFTYNSSLEGYVNFEEGNPDTIFAKVQTYKEGISTLMGESITDTNGYFLIGNLSYGTYHITVSADSYEDFTLTDIILNPYDTTKADTVCLTLIKTIEIRTVVIDGTIDEGWEPVYEDTHISDWGPSNNFDNLYLSRNEDTLYIAVSGGFDSDNNTVNVYIDKDFGQNTGISNFYSISGGAYGDHLQKAVITTESFGADLAFSAWALVSDVGVVSLEEPSSVDQHILNVHIAMNASVIEMAVPFSEMYSSKDGDCPVGTKMALVAIIGGGDPWWISNDIIPDQNNYPYCPLSEDNPFPLTIFFSRQY
ncbi:MAG: carboxypeptidase regulatory-like domain-containing protein [Candidatus Cloacimonetes bacterium]|nr:carboxypeptidase regulatory-like domain-containing protein [Candidatus Cloacimonadota bacterium]